MTRAERLSDMRNAGLLTPPQWTSTEAGWRRNIKEGDFYYCRSIDSSVEPKIVKGEHVESTLAGDQTWLVQPMLALEFGGAVYVSKTLSYGEGLAGSPVGLLRHGDLGYAWLDSGGASNAARSEQQSSRFLVDGRLVEVDAVRMKTDEDWQRTLSGVIAELRRVKIDGLVEWGWTNDAPVFLDRKLIAETGKLERYLKSRYWYRSAAPERAAHFRLPSLNETKNIPSGTPLRFDRGARLSHVVTYRASTGDPLAWFDQF